MSEPVLEIRTENNGDVLIYIEGALVETFIGDHSDGGDVTRLTASEARVIAEALTRAARQVDDGALT